MMRVSCNDLSKFYYVSPREKVPGVTNFSWQGEPGRIYGLIGPNGSGKSTVIRILLDLIKADSGTVEIDGIPGGNEGESFRRRVGYVPEERGLYQDAPALEVLTYLAELKGVSAKEARERAALIMEEMGLSDHLNSPLKTFSKGMSQKVQIIAALQHSPELTILDEPFSGLDPVNLKIVRDFILRQKSAGSTVLLSTHLMDEAERLCDHILMLNRGKLISSGPQAELRRALGRPKIFVPAGLELYGFKTVSEVIQNGVKSEVLLHERETVANFLAELGEKALEIPELQIAPPSLEELYISAVGTSA